MYLEVLIAFEMYGLCRRSSSKGWVRGAEMGIWRPFLEAGIGFLHGRNIIGLLQHEWKNLACLASRADCMVGEPACSVQPCRMTVEVLDCDKAAGGPD